MQKKENTKEAVVENITAEQSNDEALFNQLAKNKKKKRARRIRIIVIVLLLAAAVLFFGTRLLQRRVSTQFASSSEDVKNAKAEIGTISTLVSGSGMLVNVDTETVSVPSGVEVTKILVEYGDTVEVGDILATVNMASVRTAMSTLQESIEALDDEIAAAKSDTVSSYISAGVAGRVKRVFGEKGDTVEDIMVQNGALAVLSLDGYMAVDIEAAGVNKGDAVQVQLSDGTTKDGTVETVLNGKVTVLVTDNGPAFDEEVTILTAEGTRLGSGKLYIHNSLAVTGYAGTISYVNAKENQQVYSSTSLFQLTDTSTTASYDALLRTRSEYEETLLELLQIQRSSALTAPISGSVYSVADLDSDEDEEILDIVTISPDVSMQTTITISETDILSLELNQTADITVKSLGDQTLTGVVTEIDKTYSSSSYTAVITMDKVSGMIPGMTASVDIRIEGVDNAILIPYDALHQTSNGYYVYTSYDEETKEYGGKVDVIPGLSNSNYVEIKSGLKEGDTVYYTEAQTFDFGSMFGGGMPGGFSGGSGSGGGMPSGFGGSGSGSSNRPSGSGSSSRPSGMPSGGGMPSGNFGNRG